jgi:hypothetical protein
MEFDSPYMGINHYAYGRDRYRDSGGTLRNQGVFWHSLTGQRIKLFTGADATHADTGRVRIWRVPEADYDSGWVAMAQAEANTLHHNLGGPWNDFVVDLQFKDTDDEYGVNQRSYGVDRYWSTTTNGWVYYGGHWRELTGGDIVLYRASNDNDADQMRVRIWASRAPKYDSGWRSISQGGGRVYTHDLGGDADSYVLDVQYRDTSADGFGGAGVNHWNYGGDRQYDTSLERYGAGWSNLTDGQVYVYRYSDDRRVDEARVRIWIAPYPDYDSGWRNIAQGTDIPLTHSAGAGIVQLDFMDEGAIGHNQRYFGMDRHNADGTTYTELGAYWRALDSTHITVHRGMDDFAADDARVRIWHVPPPDYDSGWYAIDAGMGHTFWHDLGVATDDMVVDMQFMDAGWINQQFYGSDTYEIADTTYLEGAYWRNLTSSTIMVVRERDDWKADDVRVRIWALRGPRQVFLPLVLKDY